MEEGLVPEQMMEEGLVPEQYQGTFLRALKINTMYIFKGNKLDLPIAFATHKGTSEEKALIDSGAMENFINLETVK